ncbi:SDR family NAD(P)-dependent oxidoreductase [Thorsellia kenyensis]|uniref:SDR family NAD(P)-dependent oxidoreductase n=1 Tax=Thorsellia kenyensis TaxID=1549888 RepID=A0ABV6CG08_9GAMM
MQYDFSEQTVVITGAAQGIGRAIARAFSDEEAHVWLCDIDKVTLDETLKLCTEHSITGKPNKGKINAHVVDVTIQQDVLAFVERVGRIDILVNCAGGVRGQEGRPIEEITPSDWHALFQVNTDSTFWFSQAVTPMMKKNTFGRIINISSGAGLGISLTGIQAYAASKAAQIGLTRQLAHELGPFGITVNSIAPGFVRSNPSSERQWQKFGQDKQQQILSGIAMRRLGDPKDIANGVLFFAAKESQWITGQILSIDGGK